jgi:hypothetical protein
MRCPLRHAARAFLRVYLLEKRAGQAILLKLEIFKKKNKKNSVAFFGVPRVQSILVSRRLKRA